MAGALEHCKVDAIHAETRGPSGGLFRTHGLKSPRFVLTHPLFRIKYCLDGIPRVRATEQTLTQEIATQWLVP